MAEDDPLARLDVAQAATSVLVAAVPPPAWTSPTPCDQWDVAALVRHLVAGERVFAAIVRDGRADRPTIFSAVEAIPVADLPAAYDQDTADLLAAYRGPGAVERSYLLPIGELAAEQMVDLRIIESLTHGWDLARATDQPLAFDPMIVERAIAVSRALLEQLPPGRSPFGTPQPVIGDAPALDRLAALLGRTLT